VTGGCGFIGSHIAETLAGEGHKVRILDDLSSGHECNIAGFADKVEFVMGDIRDQKTMVTVMAGIEYVFHEAALVSVFDSVERPVDNNEINVTGTLNVLTAAKETGVKRIVVASSAAVYGDDPTLPKQEDMAPKPVSPYAVAKITKEYYMSVFAQLYGLETVCLRYFNVYGPRQDPSSMYSGVISKFTDVVRAGETPIVFGDGEQTRDFVFVKDVVKSNLLAMREPSIGQGDVFNIGTGQRASLLDLLDVLGEIAGRDLNPQFEEVRVGDVSDSVADISRAREKLGYEPEYDIREGLGILLESLED